MEEIAWDVIELIFTKTIRELGIKEYGLQQKIFSDIKMELTRQINEILERDVERMTQDELKKIMLKEIGKVTKLQPAI